MTTNNDVYEKKNAIREGHRNYAEIGYFTARPAVDFENAHKVFNDGFDRGWQAATTEANKRIVELESEVDNLSNVDFPLIGKMMNRIDELQADNNRLREALKLFKKEAESYGEAWARCYVADFDRIAVDSKKVRFDLLAIQQDRLKSFADALLSATPAESLQAHDNEVIERCAKVCDKWIGLETVAERIRSLKEVK